MATIICFPMDLPSAMHLILGTKMINPNLQNSVNNKAAHDELLYLDLHC